MNDELFNNLVPMTKNIQRTARHDYGKTKHIIKRKGMQRISERLEYDVEGNIIEIWIEFSDETSREKSQKHPGEIHTYRDEITYNWEKANRWGLLNREDAKERESVKWSTGWQDDMEGKKKEAEIRTQALKYFEKRKAQLIKKEEN